MVAVARIAILAACLLALANCGNSSGNPEPEDFSATLPQVAMPSRSEIVEMLCRGDEPPPIDVSASVFDTGIATPIDDHPDWIHLMVTLEEARPIIIDGHGHSGGSCRAEMFAVRVVGYADSVGDPGFNQRLSQARADATRSRLIDEAGYPPESVVAIPGGVAGDDPSARRVRVCIVRRAEGSSTGECVGEGAGS